MVVLTLVVMVGEAAAADERRRRRNQPQSKSQAIAIGVRRRRRLRPNRHCATDTPPRLRKPMKRTLLWPSFLACEDLSLSLALREWWVGSDRGIESAVVGADHTEMEVRNDSIRFWIDSIGIGLILSCF